MPVPLHTEVLTVEEMYAADRLAIASGVPGRVLMDAAGKAVADHIIRSGWGVGSVLVLCGAGLDRPLAGKAAEMVRREVSGGGGRSGQIGAVWRARCS